ncbi:hypothetical protein MRX96_011092 [Rhipicephalus microplus]
MFDSFMEDGAHEIPPMADISPKSAAPNWYSAPRSMLETLQPSFCQRSGSSSQNGPASSRLDAVLSLRLRPTISLCGSSLYGTKASIEESMPAVYRALFTSAELVGIHLATDLISKYPQVPRAAIFINSR